jgi:hypothetical protein
MSVEPCLDEVVTPTWLEDTLVMALMTYLGCKEISRIIK